MLGGACERLMVLPEGHPRLRRALTRQPWQLRRRGDARNVARWAVDGAASVVCDARTEKTEKSAAVGESGITEGHR